MERDKWGQPVKHYDPKGPWPFPHINEGAGRDIMQALSDASYHEADDSSREMGQARAAKARAAGIAVNRGLHPGHVEQLVQLHRGLVLAYEIHYLMIEILRADVRRLEETIKDLNDLGQAEHLPDAR